SRSLLSPLLPAMLLARLTLAAATGLGLGLGLWFWLVPERLPALAGALLLVGLTILLPALMLRALRRNLVQASAFASNLSHGIPALAWRGSKREQALCAALNEDHASQAARAVATMEHEMRMQTVLESALDCVI